MFFVLVKVMCVIKFQALQISNPYGLEKEGCKHLFIKWNQGTSTCTLVVYKMKEPQSLCFVFIKFDGIKKEEKQTSFPVLKKYKTWDLQCKHWMHLWWFGRFGSGDVCGFSVIIFTNTNGDKNAIFDNLWWGM